MKEIHAYLNDDGTYKVTVLGFGLTDLDDMNIKDVTMEIPRAVINIAGLTSNDKNQNEYFTITIDEEDTK